MLATSETELRQLLKCVRTEVEARERIAFVNAGGRGVRDHRRGTFHNASPTASALSSNAMNQKGTAVCTFNSNAPTRGLGSLGLRTAPPSVQTDMLAAANERWSAYWFH